MNVFHMILIAHKGYKVVCCQGVDQLSWDGPVVMGWISCLGFDQLPGDGSIVMDLTCCQGLDQLSGDGSVVNDLTSCQGMGQCVCQYVHGEDNTNWRCFVLLVLFVFVDLSVFVYTGCPICFHT